MRKLSSCRKNRRHARNAMHRPSYPLNVWKSRFQPDLCSRLPHGLDWSAQSLASTAATIAVAGASTRNLGLRLAPPGSRILVPRRPSFKKACPGLAFKLQGPGLHCPLAWPIAPGPVLEGHSQARSIQKFTPKHITLPSELGTLLSHRAHTYGPWGP